MAGLVPAIPIRPAPCSPKRDARHKVGHDDRADGMTFKTLDQANLSGKRVLVRVDLNVPTENGKITDTTRIERVVPTITEIADKGGKVILLAHFGRPKGRDAKDSLKPVAAEVAHVLGRHVGFADDCVGEAAEAAIKAMNNGDVLLLENTRFHKEE